MTENVCESKIYVGQIGVQFEIATWVEGCPPVDWNNATLTEIIVRRPDREVFNFPATVAADGHTLIYITESADDLPVRGNYLLQAHVVGPTYDALGETVMFTVFDVFK